MEPLSQIWDAIADAARRHGLPEDDETLLLVRVRESVTSQAMIPGGVTGRRRRSWKTGQQIVERPFDIERASPRFLIELLQDWLRKPPELCGQFLIPDRLNLSSLFIIDSENKVRIAIGVARYAD